MLGPRIDYQINPRFVPDDIPVWLGNNKDSALIFDNANDEWTVQTRNAAGTLTDRLRIKANIDAPSADLVSNPLKWTAGRAVTAADYSIGRDLDATNQAHWNVPTGATFELSVNDTPEFVLSATQLDMLGNNLANVGTATVTGPTGNTLVVDTNVLVVDATNNRVGIRTAAPLAALHIAGTDWQQLTIQGTTTAVKTFIGTSGTEFGIHINRNIDTGVFDDVNLPHAAIAVSIAGSADSEIRFRTANTNNAQGPIRVSINKDGSIQLGATQALGGGAGVIGLANAATVPSSNPTGGGILYAEAGALKWRGSSGTITTIAVA